MGFFATFFGSQGDTSIEDWMADIAAIFHWSPDVMGRFDLDELLQWRNLAIERNNQKLRFYAQLMGKKLQ